MKKFVKKKIGTKIVGSEMQETIEQEWKVETRKREKREGKEKVEEKRQNNFVNRN